MYRRWGCDMLDLSSMEDVEVKDGKLSGFNVVPTTAHLPVGY